MEYPFYQCSDCGKQFALDPQLYTCPECQQKQQADEPLRGVLEVIFGEDLLEVDDLIPVESEYFPPLRVGWTPLNEVPRLRKKLGLNQLYIKDDALNPTGSFKDRASFMVSAFAKKYGIEEIVLASTGNAGSSMAGIAAAAGQKVTLFLPASAPKAKIAQALQFGANVYTVDGNYDLAYDLSLAYSKKFGGMNRNTAYNPMTIEGKKSVSLEIFDELGEQVPDYVFVAVGDGCILAGVYKGFIDLYNANFTDKIPTIIAVQAEGSSAIYDAVKSGEFTKRSTHTVADSICVDVPRNGYLAYKYLIKYQGKVIKVSDEEILQAQHDLAKNSGIFGEPAGATAYAGLLKMWDKLEDDSCIVLLNTGSGLKDIESALQHVKLPKNSIKELSDIE